MDFLNNLEFYQIVILLLMILLSIISVILLILFKLPLKLKTKVGTISTIKDSEAENISYEEEILELDKKEFIVIIKKVEEIIRSKTVEELIIRVNKQMTFAEEKIDSAYFVIFQQKFISLLEAKKGVNKEKIAEHPDYKNFKLVLEMAKEKKLNLLKSAFQKNGFENLSKEDFSYYVERKKDLLNRIFFETYDDFYITSKTLKKEKLKKDLEKMATCEIVDEIFQYAKEVYINMRKVLLEKDKELDNFIWSLIKIKIKEP